MKHLKLAIVLSMISIVSCASVWALWLLRSLELTVVSLDTFIGVIVALLAIIVTIVLGWQIINALDLRGKMSELEQYQASMLDIEKKLADNDSNHTKLAFNLQAGLCDINAAFYEQNGVFLYAFLNLHTALDMAIKSGQGKLDERILNLKRICMMIPSVGIAPISPQIRQQLVSQHQAIISSEAYRIGLSSTYDQVMKEVAVKLNLLELI